MTRCAALVFLALPAAAATIPTTTKYNPHTGKPDYITRVSTDTASSASTMTVSGSVRLYDQDGSNYAELKGSATIPSNLTLYPPTSLGASGQCWVSDGQGGTYPASCGLGDAILGSSQTLSGRNVFTSTAGVVLAGGTATRWVKTDAHKNLVTGTNVVTLGATFDGGGSAPTATTSYMYVPYSGTITEWTLIADTTGSMVLDVKKCSGFNCNPVTSVAGSEKPTLASVWANQDSALSSWTTSVAAGDKFGFNVDSAATLTRATLIIKMEKD